MCIPFIFTFVLTSIVFALIIAALLVRADRGRSYRHGEFVLYGLGLAPAVTVWMLYVLFAVIPGRSAQFYFFSITGLFFAVGGMSFRWAGDLLRGLYDTIRENRKRWQDSRLARKVDVIVRWGLVLVVACVFVFFYCKNTIRRPLNGHDVLGYAVMGKQLAVERSLDPIWRVLQPETGFLYRTKHAPSFPLLLTWGIMAESMVGGDTDFYLRTIGTWYAVLILALQFLWLSRVNRWLAVMGLIALLSSVSFFLTLFAPHVDSFRISLLMLSWVWLGYAVNRNDRLSLVMLGVCSGLAAFAHSIGMVLACVNCFVFFAVVKSSFAGRIRKTLLVTVLVLLFGGVHYFVDLIWGRGWVLPDSLL